MAILLKRSAVCSLVLAGLLCAGAVAAQPRPAPTPPPQAPAGERGPEALSPEAIQAAVNALGTVDATASDVAFAARMNAARALRRAPADTVTPVLIHAVESHENQYVRFRALVLLSAFNDARTPGVMRDIITNPNDRLRTVAYAHHEHHPAADMIPALLQALDREESEFVRPALIRALAAQAGDPRVRETLLQEVGRGQDYFRSAVIEALGDYRATYALEALLQIARLGGPLQTDAVIAIGKLKDPRALETLATLQRSASRETQPAIAAAICLLGVNCDAHLAYLVDTLTFAETNPGYQELLRATVSALVALANSGTTRALQALFDVGIPSNDPARPPIAIGVGTVAIRNAPLMLSFLAGYPNRDAAIDVLAEGFDMLEEDYEEEGFFATVRRGYWEAPEESATRKIGQALIAKLEF